MWAWYLYTIIVIVPNIERVIIKRIETEELNSNFLVPGQAKAGENLFVGRIIHPGETSFQKEQIVYYSEYSAARLYDIGAVIRGEKKIGEVSSEKESFYIVAEDDIMAYEELEKKPKKNVKA